MLHQKLNSYAQKTTIVDKDFPTDSLTLINQKTSTSTTNHPLATTTVNPYPAQSLTDNKATADSWLFQSICGEELDKVFHIINVIFSQKVGSDGSMQ